MDLLRTLLRHWQGQLSLRTSFWWIFILPLLAVLSIPRLAVVTGPYVGQALDTTLTGLLSGFFLFVFAWQIVGVFRAADHYVREGGDRQWALAAQGAILVAVLFAVAAAVGAVQDMLQRKQSREFATLAPLEPVYRIEMAPGRDAVVIQGDLGVGVTRALRNILDTTPSVRRVVLASYGGRVYEGRGLLKLIRNRSLDTHVEDYCYSACTLAFIGGKRRTLGDGAKLGFHRYRSYTVQVNVNVVMEQQKDMQLFSDQGVSEAFARKVYSVPNEEIWEPTAKELVRYSVVTGQGPAD